MENEMTYNFGVISHFQQMHGNVKIVFETFKM